MILKHPNIPNDIITKFLDRVHLCFKDGLFRGRFILVDRQFFLKHGCEENKLKEIEYVICILDELSDISYEVYRNNGKFEIVYLDSELYYELDCLDIDHTTKYGTHAIYDNYPHITTEEYIDIRKRKNKIFKKLNENIENIEKVFNDFTNDFFNSLNDRSPLKEANISDLYESEEYEDYCMISILRKNIEKNGYYIEVMESIDDGFFNTSLFFEYNKTSKIFEPIPNHENVDFDQEVTYIDYYEWFNKIIKANKIFKKLHESRIKSFKDFIK